MSISAHFRWKVELVDQKMAPPARDHTGILYVREGKHFAALTLQVREEVLSGPTGRQVKEWQWVNVPMDPAIEEAG